MALHNELGASGEQKATEFLSQKGYEILCRNYRYGRAEIDIIARTGNIIVFTEVKTRTNYAFGYPEESVSLAKRKLLVKAASNYLYENKLEFECRFDVIAIFKSKDNRWHFKHFEDAFFLYDE